MAFSSGTYTRTDGVRSGTDVHSQQKSANILIRADLTDAELNDIATALSTCLLKDGTQTVTANIPMNSKKFTGLVDGSSAQDSATLANIQSGSIIYVSGTGGTANAQTLTANPALTAYSTGQRFIFVASLSNTGATTLNFNGLGAKNLYVLSGLPCVGGELVIGQSYDVFYDGTQFRFTRPTPVLDRKSSATQVVNTVTETDLYSFNIPSNFLTDRKILRLSAYGTSNNATGGALNLTLNVYFGGTKIANGVVVSVGAGVTKGFTVKTNLFESYLTNSQNAETEVKTTVTVAGVAATVVDNQLAVYNSLAIDTTSAQIIKITGTLASASASFSVTLSNAVLEIL